MWSLVCIFQSCLDRILFAALWVLQEGVYQWQGQLDTGPCTWLCFLEGVIASGKKIVSIREGCTMVMEL